jgi:phospholipase/carboxylesterase
MLHTELLKAQAEGATDLIIALHGLGDSMEGYRWLPRILGMPTVNVLLVNAPDAYYGGYSWYDFAHNPAPGVERSYRLMESLLDDLAENGFSTNRTVLFGFSQGCLMTCETGLRYPMRFAGLVGVSGYVHEPERLLKIASPVAREQNFLITHGTRDTLIPARQVREQIQQLKAGGMHIEYREYDKDHSILEEEIHAIRDWIKDRFAGSPVA